MAVMWGNAPTINPVAISSIGDSYFQGQKHKRDNELLDARKAYGQAINPDGSFNYSQALGLAAKAGDTESLFNFNLANQGSEEFGWKREDRDLTKEAINSATGLLGGGIAEGGRYSAALFPQGSPSPQPSASPSGGAIYKGLIDRGFAPHQAAAITGNIQQESSFKPDAWNSKEGAGGLIQWRLDRLENLKKFAAQNGKNWNDIDTQLDFIKYEMSGHEARAGSAFMAAKDLPSANAALKGYIRYGDQTQPGRLAYASAYLPGNPAVMSDAPPPGAGVAAPAPTPAQALPPKPKGFGDDPSRVPTENLLQIINNPYMPEKTQAYALALLQQRMPQGEKYGFLQGKGGGVYRTNSRTGEVELAAEPAPGDKGSEYGLAPVWGTDEQGNPALIQLGKDGQPIKPKLPEGFKISRDPIKVDMGTGTALLDPQTRQQIGFIPKDVRGEAAQSNEGKAVGEAQGKARVALPQVMSQGSQVLSIIDDIRNDPNRSAGTGKSALFSFLPGTPGYDFRTKVDQLKGRTFLEAFNSIRGGGQITEAEGKKATDALARLDTYQSEESFLAALADFEAVVRTGMERAQKQAGDSQGAKQQINSDAEYEALPSGATFVGPDGIERRKP